MTDSEMIDEIIQKLKHYNSGHFDRDNLIDSLDELDFDMQNKEESESKQELDDLKEELKSIVNQIEGLI